jgi:hypothetical protein
MFKNVIKEVCIGKFLKVKHFSFYSYYIFLSVNRSIKLNKIYEYLYFLQYFFVYKQIY